MIPNPYKIVSSPKELPYPSPETGKIEHYAFQHIDFSKLPQYVAAHHRFTDCCFFGCVIPTEMEDLVGQTCLIFPRMGMIYKAFNGSLYTGETLYDGYDPENEHSFESCFDSRVYADYIHKGKHCDDIRETLARSIHDHSMSNAMYGLLNHFDEKQVVAIMGGHALLRTDEAYRKVALISKKLTEKGKLMVSGGGPGAMEATHFGAWMAGRSMEEFEDALSMICVAPSFKDEGWLKSSFAVRKKYPQDTYGSLGIPTWFYGHEPATPFATDIAKYFDNSIREDGLLTIAKGGVIYSPGSAGTLQEIFQDAAQNHYETFGYSSPMVFLGVDYYTKEMPIYPLMDALLKKGKYKSLLLSITDDQDEVISTLVEFGKRDVEKVEKSEYQNI